MMETGNVEKGMVLGHTACLMEREDTRRSTRGAGKMIRDM